MNELNYRNVISMMGALCATVILLGLMSTTKAATQYHYVATTKAKSAAAQGPVQAGSQTWKCGGNECRISGPWPIPGLGTCKALAQMVGPLASYGHSGKWLSGKELAACNVGIKETLPSPDVAADTQVKKGKATLSTGAIQAPQGQVKKALPSPGATQLPMDSLPPAALSPPAQNQLSQSELDSMARTLNTIGSQRYRHVVLDGEPVKGGRMKLSIARADSFNGLLLLRDTSAMKSIGRGLYYDQTGNLVLNGNLLGRDGKRHRSSITLTPENQILFSKGRDNSGVIDVVFGRGKDGRMRMTGPEEGIRRLRECMEVAGLPADSDMMTVASLCASCLDPETALGSALTAEEMGCVKERADRGAGSVGGLSGRFSTNPADIDAMCKDILSSPHSGGPYRGKTASDKPKTPKEILEIIIRNVADGLPWFPTGIWPKEFDDIVNPPGPLANPEVDPNELPDAGAALYEFCENRAKSRTSNAYCYDLECARKRADDIYAISGGRCWQVPSPAGGEHTVCRQEEGERDDGSDGDPGVAPGGSGSGSTDDPRTDDLGRPKGTDGRYIDTTPLGAVLLGRCAKVGCPGRDPRMDMDRKRE